MSTQELENEALKLSPRDRARLAERLLESLENLTDEETKNSGRRKLHVEMRRGIRRQHDPCRTFFVRLARGPK